jgi:hypothetical protein
MTKKQIVDHLIEYLLLLLVLTIGFLILKFVPIVAWKVVLIFSLAAFYFGYGSYHHFSEKNLKLATVLEYAVLSVIIVIVLIVLFG